MFDGRPGNRGEIHFANLVGDVAPTGLPLAHAVGDGLTDLILTLHQAGMQALLTTPVAEGEALTLDYPTSCGAGYEVRRASAGRSSARPGCSRGRKALDDGGGRMSRQEIVLATHADPVQTE